MLNLCSRTISGVFTHRCVLLGNLTKNVPSSDLFHCHKLLPNNKNNFNYSTSNATENRIEPIQMAYSSYGDTEASKTLIIMHGMMGSRSNWNSLSKVINKKTSWRVIAVDARNHGDSPHTAEHTYPHLVEDIRFFMENLNIKKASLIGHSMGGRAVMMMALKYPEIVEKLVVVDISPIGTSPQLMHMMGYFDAMRSLRLPLNIPLSTARKMADTQLAVTISDKGLRDFLIMNLVKAENGAYRWRINLEAIANNFGTNIAAFPRTTETYMGPTLFIGGGNSDYLKPAEHQEISEIFPKAEFTYIEGAGHLVHVEKPADFLSVSVSFLQRE